MASRKGKDKGKAREKERDQDEAGNAPEARVKRPGVTLPPVALFLGAAVFLVLGFAGGYIVATNMMGTERAAGPAAENAAPASEVPGEMAALGERLKRDPNDVQAILRVAHIHLEQGQSEVAKSLYDRVLKLDPKNAEAITHIGNIAEAVGQSDAALRRYDEALGIDPKYLHALWDKAMILQNRLGKPAAAVPVWEAFLKQATPGSPDAAKVQEMLAEARKGRAVSGTQAAPEGQAAGAGQAAVATAGPGDKVAAGRRLYEQLGCPRCHAIAGRGGTIGTDLTREGTIAGRDVAWHVRHLKSPSMLNPQTVMPPMIGVSDADLEALAQYLVSLK
jgi:cytochrome c-type biogenesis protein CcmH/NrfG